MASSVRSLNLHGKAHLRVGLLGVLLLLGAFSLQTVHGHATLLSSSPADGDQLDSAPTEVVLEFSEPVGLVDGGTTLHSEGAGPLELAPEVSGSVVTIPLDPLEDGAYIIQWRVISADSHPVSDTVSFAVGDAEAGGIAVGDDLAGWVDWTRAAAVGVKYFGLLSALGVLLVGWTILRPDIALVANLARWFAAVGFLGMLLELPLAAVIQQGSTSNIWDAITNLQSNTLIAAALGGTFVVLAIAVAWLSGRDELRSRVATGLMAGAVLTFILSGHSRTREPVWLMMLSDAIHVLVAAIWLGGIVLLAIGLRGRWRGEGFSSPESSAAAVSGFSAIAGYTAAIVAASGVVMAFVILDSLEALYRTDYGISLLIKIGLVAAVAALAAVNRFSLIPRLQMDLPGALSRLRKLVSVELVVLIAVVGVTGSLVHHDPNVAVSTSQQSERTTVYEGEELLDSSHTLRLTVDAGPNNTVRVVATIIDEDRNIVLPDADLQLSWFLPDQELGPINHSLPIDSMTGAYSGEFSLPASGEWELEIQIRIDRFTDSRTTINVDVPG